MKIKQLLSGAVAFAMLVTTMPVQAFAVDDAGEATTWTKELSVDELYHAVQDQLDENNAIALENLTAIEAIASDVRDDVTGQLTAIAFDDQQVVLAELDDTTSYTLTFAEEDSVDAAPVEPDAQPEVESDAGESVTVPDESAANDPSTESQQTTGPPTQSDVSLTVTEEEVFTTEAEAEEQAQEQGVDPAEVSTEIGENGQVLGAMLTVNETEVSKVTLVYTANVQNTSDEIMPLSPMSNGETITLSVGESREVDGKKGTWPCYHYWDISGNKDIVEISGEGKSVQITAYQEGTVELNHMYREGWNNKTETWIVPVQKKEYGICTFDVYYLIGDELPDPLYGNGEAENYGPSRNDTPMCEVSIDIDTLLEDYYPNGANEGINYNGANTWYITYETCGETNPEDWWDNVLRCMDEVSKEKLRATGLFEIFQGYVLKNQNPDGDYHLDGQLDVQPPVNVVELYLDGEYIGGTAVSEDVEQTTKDELREQYETKFKTEFGEGTANWVEGNIYFQTADKYYRLTESADPKQSITDDNGVIFTNRSDEHHVARFYLTSSKMSVAYTPTAITIQKSDTEGNQLRDAQFGLYSDEPCQNQVGSRVTTDANGQATFTVTAPGTYYVKEISAPEGYVLSDETKTVTVTTTGEPTIEGDTVTFTLSASPASLTFTNKAKPTVQDVLDQFGKKAVADAGVMIPESTFRFTLTKQDGTEIATATATVTNTDSVVSISAANGTTKLDDGRYTLSENALSAEQAKAGWSKGDTEYTIKIEGGEMTVLGNAADVTTGKYLFTNTYNQPTATLTVRAIDEDGNELSAEGWPTSVPLPIGASYTVTVGMPSGTGDVNVSDEITTAQGDHYIYVGLKDGSELTGQITDDVVVTLVYGLDKIGEEDPNEGDGGAQHPDAGDDDDDDNDRDDDTEEIIDEEVPLAETPWLNTEDHYAYIIGYSEDGTVRPNANITRAEVATIFFRLLTDSARDQFWMTSNNFSDVLPNDWYNNAVSTMVNMGIIQGYEDGTFRPNANITRAEFAAIAARFMASGYGVEDDLFTDIANHWARENINDAAMAGWINGYPGGIFLPDQAITRAEAVTLVNNVLQRKPDADHMLDSMIKWPDNPEGAWYYEAIQEATNSHDYDLFEDAEYETWTALQENRDWAALEKDWVNAHRTGGEVM